MTEFKIRFLIGIIIAILIGFALYFFVITNEEDKKVDATGFKFVQTVGAICEDGREREMDIDLPQPWTAGLKDKFEDSVNWVKKTIGAGGPELEIPVQTFNDPYYSIYWELFPPEPPYYLGQDVQGTLASLFIPWSEDLPWSSNFFATVTMDVVFMGIDVYGAKGSKAFIKENCLHHSKIRRSWQS